MLQAVLLQENLHSCKPLATTLHLTYDAEQQMFLPIDIEDLRILRAIWLKGVVGREYLDQFIVYAKELGYEVETLIEASITRDVPVNIKALDKVIVGLVEWTETLKQRERDEEKLGPSHNCRVT